MEGFGHAVLAVAVLVLAVLYFEPWLLITGPLVLQPSNAPGTLLATDLQTVRSLIPAVQKLEESRPRKSLFPTFVPHAISRR